MVKKPSKPSSAKADDKVEDAQTEGEAQGVTDADNADGPGTGDDTVNAQPADTPGTGDDALVLEEPTTDPAGKTTDASDKTTEHPEASAADPQNASPEKDEPAGATADESPAEPARAPIPPAAAMMPTEQVIIRKGGFFSMLLGGAAAAVIGFGMARYVVPEGWPDIPFLTPVGGQSSEALEAARSEIATQAARIDALEAQLSEEIARATDIEDLQNQIVALDETDNALAASSEALRAAQEDLSARIDDVAKAPMSEGLSEEAVAAYQRELAALQESVATQRAEIEAMAAEVAGREAEADAMAQATLARAAVTRVMSALDNGEPFGAALADFRAASDAEVPEALSTAAETGVPTLRSLQDSLPDAARAALAETRVGTDSDGAGGLGTFLARQLGARSITPREGSDPDAVLSRVEADTRAGRLGDALAEIETLPEAAKTAMASWIDAARTRQDAIAAAETLAQRLDNN